MKHIAGKRKINLGSGQSKDIMKINLDLAKIYYSYGINRDDGIPGCIARNSTIPEELGRL